MVAARSGDQTAFSALCEPHRRALRAHCYRLLGSFDDAEDMVQETMLRAWRGREGFEGQVAVSNLALQDRDQRLPQRARARAGARAAAGRGAAGDGRDARVGGALSPDVVAGAPLVAALSGRSARRCPRPEAAGPTASVAARETIELAYIAALQHLPPRQRAILILCDVVGWSAEETAELLEATVAAVTSALQRAHATMRARLPAGRQ